MKKVIPFLLIATFLLSPQISSAQEPGPWDDASTNWEEFKETITLKSLMTDLATFTLAVKQFLEDHERLPYHLFHVDQDTLKYTKENQSGMINPAFPTINIFNSKPFNQEFQFLIETGYLQEFPDTLKWRNLPTRRLRYQHPNTVVFKGGKVTQFKTSHFAVFYHWPHADEESEKAFQSKWFEKNYPTKAIQHAPPEECLIGVKPEAMYDPSNGEDSAGFVYVDICGQHSEIGDLEIEALEKLKSIR